MILILACLWLSRVFHILTRRIAQSLTGGRERRILMVSSIILDTQQR